MNDRCDHSEEPSFTSAMEELTALVAELESDALDVDHLAERVARATELVQWCRDRLDAARFQVEEILVRSGAGQGGADVNDADEAEPD